MGRYLLLPSLVPSRPKAAGSKSGVLSERCPHWEGLNLRLLLASPRLRELPVRVVNPPPSARYSWNF